MLRVVADTNTVVSALLWHGAPYRVFVTIERSEIDFYTSSGLLDELAEVLQRHKFERAVRATGKSVHRLLQEYDAIARTVKPGRLRVETPTMTRCLPAQSLPGPIS